MIEASLGLWNFTLCEGFFKLSSSISSSSQFLIGIPLAGTNVTKLAKLLELLDMKAAASKRDSDKAKEKKLAAILENAK